MPECPACGDTCKPTDRCCGRLFTPAALPAGASRTGLASNPPPPAAGPESNIIPVNRLLLLTIASYGAYLFYWFYLTWKQYREHTGDTDYLVWHALTLCVPIYGWFRLYAHAKVCRHLAVAAGQPDTVIPVLPVLLFIFSGVALSGGDFLFTDQAPAPLGQALAGLFLHLAGMTLIAFLLCHLQRPLNGYWKRIQPLELPARKGLRTGEIVFLIIGGLFWLNTVLSLLRAAAG